MTRSEAKTPYVAIACGGTGGHLFPGLAVAGELSNRGCKIALLISPKEIDRESVKAASGVEIFTLPAVGLQNRNYFSFAGSFIKSLFAARGVFRRWKPDAVLAMGGFTGAPPVLAAKSRGARTFLHESNTIPGRANRFLAPFVDQAFVGFPEAATRWKARKVTITGTPVRAEFDAAQWGARDRELAIENSRTALGLDSQRPTVLVMGGSQGASGINETVLAALPRLADRNWQWLHLTGATEFEKVKAAYAARRMSAVVKPFLAKMGLALGAATVAVSRAGASSLAEIAATRLPSLLVPFPAAADNHQYYNALAFEKTGAAKLIKQGNAGPDKVAAILGELVENQSSRAAMQVALGQWHTPKAAEQIAEGILRSVMEFQNSRFQVPGSGKGSNSGRRLISRVPGVGTWIAALVWSLGFGSWNIHLA